MSLSKYEVYGTLCRYQGKYMNLKTVQLYVDIYQVQYMNVKSVQLCVETKANASL